MKERLRDRSGMIRKKCRAYTAGILVTVMLSLNGILVFEPIPAYAYPSFAEKMEGDIDGDIPEVKSDTRDRWEELEGDGEVILSFPSQIEAAISSPDDVDSYSFHLEEETDLTVLLQSEYPCGLELISKGSVIGASRRPDSQLLEPAGLEAGTYTLRIVPQEGIEASSYTLRISRQADRKKAPDYSEAHIAGAIFDPESPFRFYNVQNAEEKNKGGSPVHIIHYLAHWQGPVNESVMPYYQKGDFKETPSEYIHYKKAEPEFHEQNVIMVPSHNSTGSYMEHWKNAIMTYGAIDTGMTTSYNYRDKNPGDGYPQWDYRYFYAPEDWEYDKMGGHAVLIVGWDDTVKRENFRVTKRDWDIDSGMDEPVISLIDETMPEHDGAWICRDSYGAEGEGADAEMYPEYYYVSYESADFGGADKVPSAFAPSESRDNYNHLYSNSAGGIDNGAYQNSGFLRGVQVFRNEGTGEVLRAVGFAEPHNDVSYEIGVRIGDGAVQKIKSGYLKYPGFYTMRLEDGIMIPADTDFEVHVAISSDDSRDLIFYSCHDREGWINGTKAIPGKSFYYDSWDEEEQGWDASAVGEYPCIYAYTYSPLKSEITILDNKEKAEGYDTSTVPHPEAQPDTATKSEYVEKANTSTPSEAGAASGTGNSSAVNETKATPSETGIKMEHQRPEPEKMKTSTDSEAEYESDDGPIAKALPLRRGIRLVRMK
ncbi:lectin like domain-containing protein [Clostridium sp. AM58-1XD]|uniref:lectin like domain-containing protein n=1 Tax=Clostridium sp. AM58-1XD TaxID=2292307 RepID=UPI000E4D280A|nr:lectin like domain-containing protein [Clostridium sp. AM58-1XD]RGY98398.1 hypothetical protein DXA13_11380 [Clostridium sp. AM58-1XD]